MSKIVYFLPELVNENGQYEFWEDESWHDYVDVHGHHFSDKLAECASKKMDGTHDEFEAWSVAEVVTAFKNAKLKKPDSFTWGDVAYMANMEMSDLLGGACKTDSECLQIVSNKLHDVDSYEGRLFDHYMTDLMNKGEVVDWDDMM